LEFGALRSHVAKRTCSPLNFRGVNFTEQEKYLKRGRVWAAACALLTFAAFYVAAAPSLFWFVLFGSYRTPIVTSAFIVASIAFSLFYTPDYLHLNVNLTKRLRWQIKIRWRLYGAALIIGLLAASDLKGMVVPLIVVVALSAANLFAKSVMSPRYAVLYFWLTDCAVLMGLFLARQIHFLVAIALIMAAAHLAIVSCEKGAVIWGGIVAAGSLLFMWFVNRRVEMQSTDVVSWTIPILVSALATVWLVDRAQRQNRKNVTAAVDELEEFTGYSDGKIRELWATSNEQLAKNWKDANLDESDREKMTAWYRANSELYMFAISGYNLEYKRIRDSIKMLRYGRGACLDYGAGNGEIILELARRGHAAIYFDVDGTSMRFARFRAERRKLSVEFFHSKDDLAASAKQRGLDTIFSFDVLEHLPDLPGELKFLSSLLNPGGRMAFDVPAGSTKAHPMHLNHHLEVNAYMKSIGMVEERGLMERIPFRKQEKYVFRKPA
jgi:2-polyprenyl-3-methyl-5-hydroxy-6-metoxy-1,4-benzoquinol methylase